MKKLQAGIRRIQAEYIPQQESKPVTTKALQHKDSNQQFNRRPPLQRRSPIDTQAPSLNGTLPNRAQLRNIAKTKQGSRGRDYRAYPNSIALPLHNRPKPAKKRALLSKHPQQRKRVNRQKLLMSSATQSSLKQLQQQTNNALRRLGNQAERINQLSAELEVAILDLKAIASEVNQDWRALQAIEKPTIYTIPPEVCEYQAASVPSIQQKPCGSLVLTSRPVNLSKTARLGLKFR